MTRLNPERRKKAAKVSPNRAAFQGKDYIVTSTGRKSLHTNSINSANTMKVNSHTGFKDPLGNLAKSKVIDRPRFSEYPEPSKKPKGSIGLNKNTLHTLIIQRNLGWYT